MSGLNHLFQSLGALTLSAASQAVLQSTCRACRSAQRLPWYVVNAIHEAVKLSSSLIAGYAGRHGDMPDTARAFSGLAQAYQPPDKKFERGPPATSEQRNTLEPAYEGRITDMSHLTHCIKMARETAAMAMHDRSSAAQALTSFLQQIDHWAQDHPGKFDSRRASVALLSMAHVTFRAQKFDRTSRHNPLIPDIAAVMMERNLQQIPGASNHTICNVFWACARLQIRPDDLHAGAEDKLGQRFIDTQTSATLQGLSSVLWACGVLGLNPGNGHFIERAVQIIKQQLAVDHFDSEEHMQSLSVMMFAFASLRLHIEPAVAELIITRFYQGVLQGADQPQGLNNILWTCATLGYLPPPHMLQCFKERYAASKKPFLIQHDSTVAWSLAVLGVLDLEYFKTMILRFPRREMLDATVGQLYQALQALRPLDESTPEYAEWFEVTRHVQTEWPLRQLASLQSPFEEHVYHTFLQMGYQAISHYDSGDGLHYIDIAMLPQPKVPCKVAIEADGHTHYLFEDYRLDKGPHPGTRPDGRALFRNSVLERQGWYVIVVPWFEWHALLTKNAKVGYLKQKMKAVVSQYRHDTWAASKVDG